MATLMEIMEKIRTKATEIREILIQMLVIMMKLSQHMMEM